MNTCTNVASKNLERYKHVLNVGEFLWFRGKPQLFRHSSHHYTMTTSVFFFLFSYHILTKKSEIIPGSGKSLSVCPQYNGLPLQMTS